MLASSNCVRLDWRWRKLTVLIGGSVMNRLACCLCLLHVCSSWVLSLSFGVRKEDNVVSEAADWFLGRTGCGPPNWTKAGSGRVACFVKEKNNNQEDTIGAEPNDCSNEALQRFRVGTLREEMHMLVMHWPAPRERYVPKKCSRRRHVNRSAPYQA